MTKWKIPLFKIHWNKDDVNSVATIIKKGMYWATGPEIIEFENKISNYIGRKYSVTFNSGTSALHASLLSYKIERGNEIIVPSFSFISTANAPLFVGAKPIFADIEDQTFGLDPEDVKEKINNRTKAIIPVHYGGSPCLIRELKEIAEDYNLILIEDCAEAFGAKIKNMKVGTYGDSSMFSFCANKVISTGEGGAITTDSKKIYEKLKLLRSHGRDENSNYFSSTEQMAYISLGFNYRLSNITASLGISQINKVDEIIEMRRNRAAYITSKMHEIKEVITPISLDEYFNVYQLYSIRVNAKLRDKLSKYLAEAGIMTKVYFSPIHKTRFYLKNLETTPKLPITDKISGEILSLPIYPDIKNAEITYICNKINSFFKAD
tara:strand:+ start:238 stop:1371 length:1134 start_codon:yes stop_codon:yes gene_type:complete